MKWKAWLLLGVVVFVAAAAYLTRDAIVEAVTGRAAQREIARLQTAVADQQKALEGARAGQSKIDALTRQITTLRQEAAAARARADQAEQVAGTLRDRIATLDTERAAMPRVQTGSEAAVALTRRGFTTWIVEGAGASVPTPSR